MRPAELLQTAADRLRMAGIPEPRREAARIWEDLRLVWGQAPDPARERPASPEEANRFLDAVARRAAGEPLPYVTGIAGFRRLLLGCDRRALIPRPETEGLVDLVLARVPGGRVADVGTGTGCLALALADEGAYTLVLGLERSRAALALAAENRTRTGLPVALVAGDLVTALGAATVDAVVSNPPYLTGPEYSDLDRSVRDWEPESALVSGPNGMLATGRLVADASRVTRPGGWLALEVDSTRAEAVASLAARGGWREVQVHMDLFDRARYVLARRSEAE